MRLHLASTFSATIVGVLVLSILSSLLALYSAWRVEQRLEEAHKETIPSVRGEELQIALLERNALVATYLFDDGNPLRQDRLRELQDEFHHWTATVRNATHFPAEEEALLSRLEKTWADLRCHAGGNHCAVPERGASQGKNTAVHRNKRAFVQGGIRALRTIGRLE